MHTRALFLLKNSSDYSYGYGTKKSSGLRNSAQFVSDMLNASGIESKVVIVQDNNSIDKEVFNFKPSHVFVEALWVVPEKFDILVKLHPSVKWIVRIHSEIPFLAQDGIAVDWIRRYVAHPNVFVAANSLRTQSELNTFAPGVLYLPNFYPTGFQHVRSARLPKKIVNVSCFGAIRPLKNQLIQAIAAVQFANKHDLLLNFHINATRIEQSGEGILKNLRSLFSVGDHRLIEHEWKDHQDFLNVLDNIDLAMSVSFTETFSITTADAVAQAVPIVTSPEVTWTSRRIQASPTNADDIVATMEEAFRNRVFDIRANQAGLLKYSQRSKHLWLRFFGVKKKSWFS